MSGNKIRRVRTSDGDADGLQHAPRPQLLQHVAGLPAPGPARRIGLHAAHEVRLALRQRRHQAPQLRGSVVEVLECLPGKTVRGNAHGPSSACQAAACSGTVSRDVARFVLDAIAAWTLFLS